MAGGGGDGSNGGSGTRIGRALNRLRTPLIGLAGGLLGLGFAVVYLALNPQDGRFDTTDVEQIARDQLSLVTPEPPRAPLVYVLLRPSVVQITRQGEAFGDGSRAVGSGVVVDANGSILTSNHVLGEADTVTVHFFDGSASEAAVTDRDPSRDLAIVRVGSLPDGAEPAVLGGGVVPGDAVFAIGSPFALDGSISEGIVSALGRSFRIEETGQQLDNMIQFDAAVNPGSSGGPLVDREGRVIGIVTGLANPSGQQVFIGLGFAVPIRASGGLLTPVD